MVQASDLREAGTLTWARQCARPPVIRERPVPHLANCRIVPRTTHAGERSNTLTENRCRGPGSSAGTATLDVLFQTSAAATIAAIGDGRNAWMKFRTAAFEPMRSRLPARDASVSV